MILKQCKLKFQLFNQIKIFKIVLFNRSLPQRLNGFALKLYNKQSESVKGKIYKLNHLSLSIINL